MRRCLGSQQRQRAVNRRRRKFADVKRRVLEVVARDPKFKTAFFLKRLEAKGRRLWDR